MNTFIPPGAAVVVGTAVIIMVAVEEIALTCAVDMHASSTVMLAGIWDVKSLLEFCMK
jgi:hypothetical protein